MSDVRYGVYTIHPIAPLKQNGKYSAAVTIELNFSDGVRTSGSPRGLGGDFDTEDQSHRAAVQYGKDIIDGNVPGQSPP
jgi:hypothetical protein